MALRDGVTDALTTLNASRVGRSLRRRTLDPLAVAPESERKAARVGRPGGSRKEERRLTLLRNMHLQHVIAGVARWREERHDDDAVCRSDGRNDAERARVGEVGHEDGQERVLPLRERGGLGVGWSVVFR